MNDIEAALENLMQMVAERMSSGQPLSDPLKQALSALMNEANELFSRPDRSPPFEPPTEVPAPMGADLLWILAGGKPEAFVNYLRTVPDPAMNALVRNPGALRSIIDELSQRYPEGINLQADGIPHADMLSSNIYGYQYNPSNKELSVRFNNGGVYKYQGVPRGVYQVFANGAVPAKTSGENNYGRWWRGKSPSLGAAFHEMIKMGGYPYQKVS